MIHFRISLFIAALTLVFAACTDDVLPEIEVTEEVEVSDETQIWTGPFISFSKANGADPMSANNQDRITDNVAITRGNDGGQIFNIITEAAASSAVSPQGTEWAVGTIDQLDSLSFSPFRTAVGDPRDVVDQDLVVHLISDDIFFSLTFTFWNVGRNNGGGFAYERSTP